MLFSVERLCFIKFVEQSFCKKIINKLVFITYAFKNHIKCKQFVSNSTIS